jgi:GNAT superfamily N-acetyltransferase
MMDSKPTRPQPGTDRPAQPHAVVRRATIADARAIAEIAVLGWQAAYGGILPADFLANLSIGAREVAWRTVLESDTAGHAPAWVAELEGRVVGFVSSGPPRDEDVPPSAAEVYAIYVLPGEWRRGLGRALLNAAIAHWQGGEATALVLWVFEANGAARTFYEAMGWRADGGRQEIDLGGFSTTEVRYRLSPQPPPGRR